MTHRFHHLALGISLGIVVAMGVETAAAVPKPDPGALSENGEKLQARYAAVLAALKAEIAKAVPVVAEQKKAAFLKACEAEKAAATGVNTAQQDLVKGRNVLRFSRQHESLKGVTIKEFTLTPVK